MRKGLRTVSYLSAVLLLGTVLIGCAGRQQAVREEDSAAQAQVDAPVQKLDKKYSRVVIKDFEVPADVAKDYPEAATTSKVTAITKLGQKGIFSEVLAADSRPTADTLLVKTKIREMRIVSSAARMWAGAMAGSSSMTLDVELLDGATGKVVGTKELSSANNAFGAAWTGGSSDVSLPSDMGAILAEHLAAVNP